MANKKQDIKEPGVIPVDFFGDVVTEESKRIVSYDYHYGNKSIVIKCKRFLSCDEKHMFVNSIWRYYISPDTDGNKDYRPYLLDILIRFFTVKFYCINLPVSFDANISEYEEFLVNTSFYDELIRHINCTDYKFLLNSLHEYINKRCDANIVAVKSAVDTAVVDIINKLNKLVETIGEKLDVLNNDDLIALISNIMPSGGVDDGREAID